MHNKQASRNLAHIYLTCYYDKSLHGLGLRFVLPDIFFSLTVADRRWCFGERLSAETSEGPTEWDLTK